MDLIMWLVVLGTSIWVAVDASNLGVRRGGLNGGFLDMGVAGWLLSSLLFWIVGFPAYLILRRRYVEAHRATTYAARPDGFVTPVDWQPDYATRATGPAQPLHGGAESALVDDLSRLANLRDSGAVSQSEFDALKARLMAGPRH